MAYVQKSKAVNICIRKNGSEMLLDGGTVTLPVIGGNTTDRINASAYTSSVSALRIYNNNSTPPVSDVLGASSVVSGSFLFTAIPNNGDYIDIYNKTHGVDSRLRVSFYRVSGGIYEYSFNIIYQGTSYNINGGGVPSYGGSPERGLKLGVSLDDTYPRGCIYVFRGYAGGTPFYQLDGLWSNASQAIIACRAAVSDIFGEIAPEPPGPSYNPYADGDFSEPSGDPTGDYDDTSDVINVPSVPSFNLGLTSLINVWVPSVSDINALAAYLWSNFDLTDATKTLSKLFTDPLSYILSLHMLPFTVDSSAAITVTLGGYATTVSMPPATVQFKDIDCGSVTINEYWGNYLDYTYTKIVLCLPFCGQVDLDPDEVMGKTIKVKYRVDVITGAFVCFVYIDGDKVLGQYAGNCAAQVPVSAADFSRLNAAVLGVAGAAASAFGSAALGGHGGMLNGASGGLISSIAANSQNAKVRAQHSGGLTGAPGFMGIQKPYLIIHRPRQSVPEDYEQFKGYPSNVTMQLSSCTGFTSVREIKLDGLPFTDGELSELKSILEGGVIL